MGRTAIMEAASGGHGAMVELLVEKGGNITEKDKVN